MRYHKNPINLRIFIIGFNAYSTRATHYLCNTLKQVYCETTENYSKNHVKNSFQLANKVQNFKCDINMETFFF